MRRRAGAIALLLLGPLVLHPVPAHGGTFTVTPVRVFLSAKSRTAMLTLRNTSRETLRFELEAFGWDEDRQGKMDLQPTTDVVFFPKLFTVDAGEQRHVRIGLRTPPGPVEKTFRIFVNELPLVDPKAARADGIQLLTRVGVPIFLAPSNAVQDERIDGIALRRGRLSFAIVNSGTVHVLPKTLVVKGHGSSGETVSEWPLRPWYVLAGGTRVYEIGVRPEECARLTAIVVELETDRRTATERIKTSGSECR